MKLVADPEELFKFDHNPRRQILIRLLPYQIMPCALDLQQPVSFGQQRQRSAHFFMGTKGVAAAVHKQRRRLEPGKVRRAQLCRFARRVQWIRQQKQSGSKIRVVCCKHGGLASSIRVPPEKNAPGCLLPQNLHGATDAFSVARSHGREWWAMRPRLAERQIKAQGQKACFGKRSGHRSQQFRLAISSSAMRKRQRIAIGLRRLMQKASDRRFSTEIGKFLG